RELEAGIPTVNEPPSMMGNFFALRGMTLALLFSGRWGDLMRVVRTGKGGAERKGNGPRLFRCPERSLRPAAVGVGGAPERCDTVTRQATEYPTGQPQTIAKVATAYARLANRQYPDALQTFAHVLDTIPKFFLHWYWRMNSQLGLSEAWLAAGNVRNARTEA